MSRVTEAAGRIAPVEAKAKSEVGSAATRVAKADVATGRSPSPSPLQQLPQHQIPPQYATILPSTVTDGIALLEGLVENSTFSMSDVERINALASRVNAAAAAADLASAGGGGSARLGPASASAGGGGSADLGPASASPPPTS
ncbi:unnamed protein product [Rotaria sp. Silwood1]|nr:unnamed protein product [Rotaria sp. Silwood1]CAF3469074.1 unnamed protein product [Rotaria sp. Silwood1]CAF5087773.1 unnamed protein product [Rotaria sp. Silwood1]